MFCPRSIVLAIFVLTILGTISNTLCGKVVPLTKLVTCKEYDSTATPVCQHFFPINIFKNYVSSEYKLYLKFYVMARNDANIVLSNDINTNNRSTQYITVIGGYNNEYSWIRNSTGATVGLDSHLKNTVSAIWATPIIVRQRFSGELEVVIPDVADPLLKADARDLNVKSLCLYAWKTESRWFYNCDEEEDSTLDTDETESDSEM